MQIQPDRQRLSPEQGQVLLRLARRALADRFAKKASQKETDELDRALNASCFQAANGTFVTLTLNRQLRGCIGNLAADESIRSGIHRNAINAAFHDPRFAPLTAADFDKIEIEVSILSKPRPLEYSSSADLLAKLRPGVDGVIVRKGSASATFLPQVWDQLPQARDFLSNLCAKAGLSKDAWENTRLDISVYEVQHFAEHR